MLKGDIGFVENVRYWGILENPGHVGNPDHFDTPGHIGNPGHIDNRRYIGNPRYNCYIDYPKLPKLSKLSSHYRYSPESPFISVCHSITASFHIPNRRLFRFATVSWHHSTSRIAVYFDLSQYHDIIPYPTSLFVMSASVSWHHLHTKSLLMFVSQRQPLSYVFAGCTSVQQWMETSMSVYARSG